MPHQGFLPVRPRLGARALAVGQSHQHQRIQISLVLNNIGELGDGRGIIEIALLGHAGERQVVIDQKNQRFALLRS